MGDHTEAFQVDYDPEVISYDDLLKIFWKSHNPCRPAWSRQYMSAVFYHDKQQQNRAIETSKALNTRAEIQTGILPLGEFYLAEDYHQKYWLQNHKSLARELHEYYPNFSDFVNSTVVARLNGYISGDGKQKLLQEELDQYGLSESTKKKLTTMVNR